MDIAFVDRLEEWSTKAQPLLRKLKEIFGFDKRSLALFRIGLAIVTLGDLYDRNYELHAHYTDWGVIPRSKIMTYFWNYYWISAHMMSGTELWQLILVILQLISTLCMLVGYRTKLSTFITWYFICSFQSRNFMIGHGGDIVHRMYIFWSLFFPCADYFSVDAALKPSNNPFVPKKRKKDNIVANGGTIAMMLQVCFLYGFSYIHKTGPHWREDYQATYFALNLDYFKTSVAEFFLMFPELLKFLTWAVLLWEGFGYYFFFAPIFNPYFKFFGVFGYFVMHMAFQSCLRLSIFGWICGFGVFCMIPSFFWDSVVFPMLRKPFRTHFQLYIHPQCRYCFDFIRIIKTFFLIPETRINALQEDGTDVEGNHLTGNPDIWLVSRELDGQVSHNYYALLAICRVSPILWPLQYLLRIPFLAKWGSFACTLHDHQAEFPKRRPKHRTNFPNFKMVWKIFIKIVVSLSALVFIYICFSWNMTNIGYASFEPSHETKAVAWVLHMDQAWGMFSPHPPTSQWWYVFHSKLKNGTEVELFKDGGFHYWKGTSPVTYDRPKSMFAAVTSHRWFKFFEQFNSHQHNQEIRSEFFKYVCREWNQRYTDGEQLSVVDVWFLQEQTNLDGTRTFMGKQIIWHHECFKSEKNVVQ